LTALVLDAGALIAYDRGDREIVARFRFAEVAGIELRTSAIVIAQAWRDPIGRQVRLARLLRGMNIRVVDEPLARRAGVLLGRSHATDAVDATVAVLADDGDEILTSDPTDLARLCAAAGRRVAVTRC
jgi:hypothetical protein